LYIEGLLAQTNALMRSQDDLIQQVTSLRAQLSACRNSWTFRIGKLVVFPFRPLKLLLRAARRGQTK
jgi:hypothetical protein